ncbi:uncharacterized protein LOC144478076, partial [Augochlora pura]
ENTLPKPETTDNINLLHMQMGETLYMECFILIPRTVDYNIYWVPVHEIMRVSTWFDIQPDLSGFVRKVAFLEVKVLDFSDEGVYECKVKKGIYAKYARTYVLVY